MSDGVEKKEAVLLLTPAPARNVLQSRQSGFYCSDHTAANPAGRAAPLRCRGNAERFAPTSEDSARDDRESGAGSRGKASLMEDVLTASLEAAQASCFRSEAAQIVEDSMKNRTARFRGLIVPPFALTSLVPG